MKHRTLATPIFALFFGTLLLSAQAQAQTQPRIAIVDLRKVFESYYRTEEMNSKIKEEVASIQKTGEGMLDDYRKANEEYKQLMDSANDTAISAEEKQKRRKSAEDKLIDIRALEQSVQKYRNQADVTIGEKKRRMRDQILKEIRETVVTKAKAGGFTLVIDIAAESVNQTPIILYTNGENDLTDQLLKQLNASAPASAAKPSTEKDKK